jgi:putative Ca2+/H+ antiporter (TMEM165/GDT1 family)
MGIKLCFFERLYEDGFSRLLAPNFSQGSGPIEGGNLMDWRIFLTTFGVIFLAEMGDKTQLAAMTMAAESKRPWAVFIGSALALTAVSAIGVALGSVIGNYLPLIWIKRAAAVAFIVIGLLILLDKF